jgi:hypothetical protein
MAAEEIFFTQNQKSNENAIPAGLSTEKQDDAFEGPQLLDLCHADEVALPLLLLLPPSLPNHNTTTSCWRTVQNIQKKHM